MFLDDIDDDSDGCKLIHPELGRGLSFISHEV